MKLLLISFSELPVYADSLIIQNKYLKEKVETYCLGSNKFKDEYKNSNDNFLCVNTPHNPRPSLSSYKFWKKEKKNILNFIKEKGITHIYFINKHIWNIFLILKLNKNIKVYHCLHDPVGHSGDKVSKGVLYYNKVLIHYLDGIIVLSENSFNDVKTYLKPKCPVKKVPLIQTEWKDYKEITKVNKEVLFFGRLNNYKGLDYVPLIAENLYKLDKDIKIVVAGKKSDDLDEAILENLKQCPNVILNEGFVPNNLIDEYYYHADIILMPYKSITQSGIVVDSYNHSRTLACFKINGIEEFITNDNALIINDFDCQKMAEEIFILLNDFNKLKDLSFKSYKLGEKLYSPKTFRDEFLDFIK